MSSAIYARKRDLHFTEIATFCENGRCSSCMSPLCMLLLLGCAIAVWTHRLFGEVRRAPATGHQYLFSWEGALPLRRRGTSRYGDHVCNSNRHCASVWRGRGQGCTDILLYRARKLWLWFVFCVPRPSGSRCRRLAAASSGYGQRCVGRPWCGPAHTLV